MQRFLARDAKFSYSPGHAAIGTVQPGEQFEVESVEGFYNSFASASDFTPERYAEAEKLKWAVTGPISVAGAGAGDAVAVTIHAVEVDARRRRLRRLHRGGTARVVGRRERLRRLSRGGRHAALRRAPTLPTRPLIGCLAVAPADAKLHAKLQGRYGGNLDCREIRAGATLVLPVEQTAAGSSPAIARRSWATVRSSARPRSARSSPRAPSRGDVPHR